MRHADIIAIRSIRMTSDEISFARVKRREQASFEGIAKMLSRPVQQVRDAVCTAECQAFQHHIDELVALTSKDRARVFLQQAVDALGGGDAA